MKTVILLSFLIVVFHKVNGAEKCYLCIDDQCKTNPYVQNCASSSAVCVSNTYQLYTGEWLTSKYCSTLDSDTIKKCKDRDNGSSSNSGCYYCRKDLCN